MYCFFSDDNYSPELLPNCSFKLYQDRIKYKQCVYYTVFLNNDTRDFFIREVAQYERAVFYRQRGESFAAANLTIHTNYYHLLLNFRIKAQLQPVEIEYFWYSENCKKILPVRVRQYSNHPIVGKLLDFQQLTCWEILESYHAIYHVKLFPVPQFPFRELQSLNIDIKKLIGWCYENIATHKKINLLHF